MDTALPQKLSFILDRNFAKANCTGNRVCTSCDIVLLVSPLKTDFPLNSHTIVNFKGILKNVKNKF